MTLTKDDVHLPHDKAESDNLDELLTKLDGEFNSNFVFVWTLTGAFGCSQGSLHVRVCRFKHPTC